MRARYRTTDALQSVSEYSALGNTLKKETWQDLQLRTKVREIQRKYPRGNLAKRIPLLSFSGYESNALFHNRGDGTFAEIGVASGSGLRLDTRGVAVVDYDRDGRLDLVMSNFNRRPLVILRNQGTSDGAWLGVELRGTKSNRFGIGARVTVKAGDRQWVQEVEAGNGFLSSQPADLHFGLGEVSQATVEVRWPTGEIQQFPVTTRTIVTITEGSKAIYEDCPDVPDPPAQAAAPRPARAGDPFPPARLEGVQDEVLPPEEGRVVLVLFSGGCFQCQNELKGARLLDEKAAALADTRVVWASLDADKSKIEMFWQRQNLDRSYVMVDAKTMEALLGPGQPALPVAFIVSKDRIEAKFVGEQAAVLALKWIERHQDD